MMCEQAELRIAELLVGEIAPAERAALERHLLDCAGCRGDFELARAGFRVEWADVSVPKEVIDATIALFREPPAAVRLLRWATAAAAVVGVAALLLTSSRNPMPVPARSAALPAQRRDVLATMQDPVIGALVCKDEEGRPVGELGLKSHAVTVEILDGIAKTTVEENFENHTDRRLEGTFNFPLPSDASISRLALEVNGKIEEGTCLERERAREVFESIVRKMQDPALLEWQPGGFFKCRVFPIEPRSTKRVIVAYTQALPCFQGKMTYVYPLASEKTRTHPPEEVRIDVQARFSGALAKIESPSHRLDVQRKSAAEASMSFRAAHYRPNNDFVVTMEPGDEEVRVVSHRPEGEEGYFACFVTPRGGGERRPGRYAIVLDASASISAPRLEVAKRLVRAMMERRLEGDRFEILAHNIEVERSGEVDLRAANDFMDRIRPMGGSDVLKALLAAGDADLIYIGKGAPTFGESDPSKILEAVKGRRIRTIAVGSDANGLLLEKLGGMMRVNPNDDVPKRVLEIAATLGSPVLAELKVEGEGISEVVGLRDLFYGERVVVSGRYRDGAAKLRISGRGYRREVEIAFPAKEEGNNYVRRLWAQRKVADLLAQGESKKPEVTALGVKHQIMTPYTSFLVLETEQMWKDFQLKREVQKQDQVLGKSADKETRQKESQRLYEQALALSNGGNVEKARGEARKSLEAWSENTRTRQLLNDLSRIKVPATDPSKRATADEHYRLGERYYQAGDFEKAVLETQKALGVDPKHAPARALYTETQFILGQGKTTPSTQEYDKFMRDALVRLPEEARSGKSTEIPDTEEAIVESGRPIRALQQRNFSNDATVNELQAWSRYQTDVGDAYKSVDGRYTKGWDEYLSVTALEKFPFYKDGSTSLKTLSTAESDFRANDRDWNHVNDFWTYNVAGLYKMTNGEEPAGQLKNAPIAGDESSVENQRAFMAILTDRINSLDTENSTKAARISELQRQIELSISGVGQQGGNLNMAPKKALEAKVTAVAKDMVVISIGKDDGVLEGDQFSVHRGGDFVARIVIDRSDRKWSAGKILLKRLDPRVADDVGNHVFATLPRTGGKVVSAEGDRVRLVGSGAAGNASDVLALTRGSKFVALVRVGIGTEKEFAAQVFKGLAVGRILPGDVATPVRDVRAYLEGLPAEVRMDLASRSNQQTIRAKMGLKQ